MHVIGNTHQSIPIPETPRPLPGVHVATPGNYTGDSGSNIAPRVDLHVLETGIASAL
jgi:hypothetical protein